MSAYAEFDKERQGVDTLLRQGYSITSIQEDLDGARVKFISSEPGKSSQELLLLTADARKHVTTVLFAGINPVTPIGTHM